MQEPDANIGDWLDALFVAVVNPASVPLDFGEKITVLV